MFRKVTVSLDILTDPSKRNYLDTRLESDRRKKAQYAEMNKRKQGMVDALHAREEEAKRAKVDGERRRREAAEEEDIKEAGRRMLEEAQKRREAAAAAAAQEKEKVRADGHGNGVNASNGGTTNGSGSTPMPTITPLDLTLILTIPPLVPTHNLRLKLETNYGPISHFILKDPTEESTGTSGTSPGAGETKTKKKKKEKGQKAIVEFQKGNWGGCWACWKDHQKSSTNTVSAVGDGVRAKWASGSTPAWIDWAASQPLPTAPALKPGSAVPSFTSSSPAVTSTDKTPAPSINFSATAAPPSFTSAPDFGSTTMADLLASHHRGVEVKEKKKQQDDEFESMTLLRMRQMERERLEAEIRAEEGD